jgi:hypothetical protein
MAAAREQKFTPAGGSRWQNLRMAGVPRYGLTRKSERAPDGWPFKDSDFAASAFPSALCRRPQSSETLFWHGYMTRFRCRRLHVTRGHIASQDGTRHAPYYCWRFGFADRLSRHYQCGPPKTLWFFASARFALLRCKTPKTLAVPLAIRPRSDVAAASRGFSRPHLFLPAQRDMGSPSTNKCIPN